jgi:hypothetical protein
LICPAGTAPISEALPCGASCHVAGEALATVKAGRIAPPVSTPTAVIRAPAWLVMLVNMAGFPFCCGLFIYGRYTAQHLPIPNFCRALATDQHTWVIDADYPRVLDASVK